MKTRQELNASVQPHDSVSQVGHDIADERSSSASSSSLQCARSGRSGARCLLAKVPALKEQHALELEELELKARQDAEKLELNARKEAEKLHLKSRKEALALKTDLAVASAKVSVFAAMQDQQDQQASERGFQAPSSSSMVSCNTEFLPPVIKAKPPLEKATKMSPMSLNHLLCRYPLVIQPSKLHR